MNEYLNYLLSKYRFSAWLIVFLILLLFIPLLISANYNLLAKTLGVFIVILVSIALWKWRMQTVNKIMKASRIKLNLNDRFWLDRHISFYNKLNKSDKIIFEDRLGLFLAEIVITEIGKEVPDKETCFYVASSAIIAYWGLPYWNYGELSEVIIYPDNFTVDNVIKESADIEGKVYHGGIMDSTMILSLTALKKGFSNSFDNNNVGIHEFSHQVDKSDGKIGGKTYYVNQEEELIWFHLLDEEIKKIEVNNSDLNSYAASNYSEFFAVIMEYYKENPVNFEKEHFRLFHFLKEKLSE
jgi:hypothetical protein